MSYQVLARKWRPKNFGQVAGQEHILRALSNALTQKRLHHAYLFSGTRGVGKTTIARILAKCINCESGITATPCDKCDNCAEIDAGRSIDLIEVDAASRTKVEDTRDLLDNVQYLPAKARCKIYLIDEVHMLSGHSFNALLKTLEEPPAHVKFLLATTDPQHLPVTVLSRCLQFHLKALSPELIVSQLSKVLQQEQINFEPEALQQLALAANGSVRDALSLLDQAIAYGQNTILTADVSAMLGTVESSKLFKLVEALANSNGNNLLATINELAELGADFTGVLNELLNILHQIAIAQIIKSPSTNLQHYAEAISHFAQQINPNEIQLYYQIGLIGKRDLPLMPSPRMGFEMIMLRMLAFAPQTIAVVPRLNKEEHNKKEKETETQSEKELSPTSVLKNLQVSAPTRAVIDHCQIVSMTKGCVELLLDPSQAPLLNPKLEERLAKAFTDLLQAPTVVKIAIGSANMQTIAKEAKQAHEQKKLAAANTIKNDAQLEKIINEFNAKILPDSVQYDESEEQ